VAWGVLRRFGAVACVTVAGLAFASPALAEDVISTPQTATTTVATTTTSTATEAIAAARQEAAQAVRTPAILETPVASATETSETVAAASQVVVAAAATGREKPAPISRGGRPEPEDFGSGTAPSPAAGGTAPPGWSTDVTRAPGSSVSTVGLESGDRIAPSASPPLLRAPDDVLGAPPAEIGTLVVPPSSGAAAAHAPGGTQLPWPSPPRPGDSAAGLAPGSAASSVLGAALVAALLSVFVLAIPRAGRRIRPSPSLGWSPAFLTLLEHPG
jgi:hypothetical protein